MIFGKVANQKFVLSKFSREYDKRIDTEDIRNIINQLNFYLPKIKEATDEKTLRGYEGFCAELYFSVLDNLILVNKDKFFIKDRNRRPPKDNANAIQYSYNLDLNLYKPDTTEEIVSDESE